MRSPLLPLIVDYQRDVVYCVETLKKKFLVDDLLAARQAHIIPRNGEISPGFRFEFHSHTHCRFSYQGRAIEMNFGTAGHVDSFDAAQLLEYARSVLNEDTPHYTAIARQLSDLQRAGKIKRTGDGAYVIKHASRIPYREPPYSDDHMSEKDGWDISPADILTFACLALFMGMSYLVIEYRNSRLPPAAPTALEINATLEDAQEIELLKIAAKIESVQGRDWLTTMDPKALKALLSKELPPISGGLYLSGEGQWRELALVKTTDKGLIITCINARYHVAHFIDMGKATPLFGP